MPGGRVTDGAERRTSADGQALTIRLFEPGDEAAVLELLGAAFGAWPRDAADGTRSEFFRWKHLESPFGRSLMTVVEMNGSIVGFYAFMPWVLCVGGRTVATMRAVDLAIDPRHGRTGISLALRSATEFSHDVEFVWGNPNGASTTGGRRLGRREVNGLRSFVRPCAKLSQTLRPHALRAHKRAPRPAPTHGSAATALADRALLDRMNQRAALRGEQLATLRHDDYLHWRYGRWPSYRAVCTDAPGEAGMAIFRCRRQGRFAVADVCELLLERHEHGLKRRLLGRVAAAAGADFVLCNFSSRRSAASCGLLGYATKESLMALILTDGFTPDPSAARSWALSRGDLELL